MAGIVEALAVRLSADTSDFDKGLDASDKKWAGFTGKLDSAADSMKSVGGKMTAGITLPLVGLGVAAIAAGNDLNAGMANVQSLGIAEDRVVALKGEVQDLSIVVGKGTSDMTDGLYQVVSAFGDSSESMDILTIAAKAGAAGLATTTDAINLTSAVTKGYGDTSAEAVQKTADLAFQTVKLGQTTFPELAASMGKVVPIAAGLGVTQEELFAQMATLTGVTGGAAEVSTQLRATYQALLKPTGEMGGAISNVADQLDAQGKLIEGPLVSAWRHMQSALADSQAEYEYLSTEKDRMAALHGSESKEVKILTKSMQNQSKVSQDLAKAVEQHGAALGPTIVESVGLTDALGMLTDEAGGNTQQLGKMFGSVEAVTAVMALSGGQADTFAEKLEAMSDVTGASDAAFAAQTEGINAAGFSMQQAAVKGQVLLQKLGDGLAPAVGKVIDAAGPLIDKLVQAADWFSKLDADTQTWIVTAVAVVAAIGPMLVILGTVVGAISSVIGVVTALSGVFALLLGPIGLIILAVAGLALAWSTDFLGIRTKTQEFWTWLSGSWPGWTDNLKQGWQTFSNWWQSDTQTKVAGVQNAFQNWAQTEQGRWQTLTGGLRGNWETFTGWWQGNTQGALSTISGLWQQHGQGVQGIAQNSWSAVQGIYQTQMQVIQGVVQAGMQFMRGDWEGGFSTLQSTTQTALDSLRGVFASGMEAVAGVMRAFGWEGTGRDIIRGVVDGIKAGTQWLIDTAKWAAQNALNAMKAALGIGSPSKEARRQVGAEIMPGAVLGVEDSMPSAMRSIDRLFDGLFDGFEGPQLAGAGSGGPIQITVHVSGENATYENGRAVGAGISDELKARGLG